jgi:hypothetical protein
MSCYTLKFKITGQFWPMTESKVAAASRVLGGLMFWGARDDGEGPPGLRLAMLPAFGVLIITVALYYGALGARGVVVLVKKITSPRRPSVR